MLRRGASCLLVLACLLTASTARAEICRDWTPANTTLQTTGATLIVLDWAQTRAFTAENPRSRRTCTTSDTEQRCRVTAPPPVETNPWLGAHPSPSQVNAFFASALLLHWVASCALGPDSRPLWQSFVIGLEANQVWHNHQVGVRISANW